jgi:hypothetical protein
MAQHLKLTAVVREGLLAACTLPETHIKTTVIYLESLNKTTVITASNL